MKMSEWLSPTPPLIADPLAAIKRHPRMNIKISIILTVFISTISYGQETDTLTFYSEAFKESRTVFIHKPEYYKYQSDSVKLPVIYLLDGQHDWFVNPLLSDIEYLQYTHQIANAIIVTIPHNNRIKECGITDLKTKLPLDIFIKKELDGKLQKYHPSDFKVIIGHSFSASFSLYSFYNQPDYYSAVIANSPLDEMEILIKGLEQAKNIDKTKISISVGGIANNKDIHHRKKYNQLKTQFPSFFNSINTFEADYSGHNAVPIVATPSLLSKVFENFSDRYSKIAPVDMEYKLINVPESEIKEMNKILNASKIGEHFYPPEIPDINGIASRYWNNGYENYAIKVYELGTKYYPYDYGFLLSLYELTLNHNKEKAKSYLLAAQSLLNTIELDSIEILKEIEFEKEKNGW